LVPELTQLFQLHELGRSTPKLVQACRRLHAQTVNEGPRLEGGQHVVHCHLRAEVSNAHSGFPKPINESSKRLSLFLSDADQCYGRQVVGAACCELNVELGHQGFKAIH